MTARTREESQADSSVELGPTRQLVDGRWLSSSDGRELLVSSPSTKQAITSVPRTTAEDVDRAVRAARQAFAQWKRVPPVERGRILLRIADSIERRAEQLARITAHETGNAIRTQSRPEVQLTIDVFRYFGGLASELKGTHLPLGEGVLSYTRKEPIGVVGAITPWNSPLGLVAVKLAPALCAGNTVVLKLAEEAPLGGLLLAEICSEHLPNGVLNVLVGVGVESGAALARHPGVDKLSFTGSTAVGKTIMASASERLVPVSLELGGKSPSIVYEDADEDWAIEGVITAMRFSRQSQSCTAGSRLFLHERIHDSFLGKLKTRVEKYVIGEPLDEASDIGCLISGKQFGTVCDYIREGLETTGVSLVTGGLPPSTGPLSKGYYTVPTVFSGAGNDWRLAREEIFGPVLVAIPFKDEAEAVRLANDSHYGLAAFVFSRDVSKALRTAHAIDSGWVQVNQGKGQQLGQPYGGFKQSGIGKELALESMLESFSRTKSVTLNLDL